MVNEKLTGLNFWPQLYINTYVYSSNLPILTLWVKLLSEPLKVWNCQDIEKNWSQLWKQLRCYKWPVLSQNFPSISIRHSRNQEVLSSNNKMSRDDKHSWPLCVVEMAHSWKWKQNHLQALRLWDLLITKYPPRNWFSQCHLVFVRLKNQFVFCSLIK